MKELTAEDIRRPKAETAKDIGVAGPKLAATHLAQGLVDEVTI